MRPRTLYLRSSINPGPLCLGQWLSRASRSLWDQAYRNGLLSGPEVFAGPTRPRRARSFLRPCQRAGRRQDQKEWTWYQLKFAEVKPRSLRNAKSFQYGVGSERLNPGANLG